MLKEYALQPELLADWTTCRFLLDKFGYDRGRVISRYPRKWTKLVHDCLVGKRPREKKRIEEAIIRLTTALYSRCGEWDVSKKWLANALEEHSKRPFCAVVTTNDTIDHHAIIKEEDLDEEHEPRWKAERQQRIRRTAIEMAACAKSLLYNAKRVLFIDPHFDPQKPRFRQPLEALLKTIADREPNMAIESIEIHCGDITAGVKQHFDIQCKSYLPQIIPNNLKVRLVRWEQSYLHNRYILTEKAGLKFGIGLDEQLNGNLSFDTVDLLDPKPYADTWNEYQRGSSVFPLIEDDLVIQGTAL